MFRAVFIGILMIPLAAFAGPTYPSRAPARAYSTNITQEMLDRSPEWKETEANPPLAARKALEAADAVVSELEPDTKFWTRGLEGLVLCRNESKWYWRAEYRWHGPPGTALGGVAPYMTVIVLMDGTVVPPKVEE